MYDSSGRPWGDSHPQASTQTPTTQAKASQAQASQVSRPRSRDLSRQSLVSLAAHRAGGQPASFCLLEANAKIAQDILGTSKARLTVSDEWLDASYQDFVTQIKKDPRVDIVGPTLKDASFDFVYVTSVKKLLAGWRSLKVGGLLAGNGYLQSNVQLREFAKSIDHAHALQSNRDGWMIRKSAGIDVSIVSTGFNAKAKDRCLASVASQKYLRVEHIYVEASSQRPAKPVLQNQYEAMVSLPSERVVVMLDGDDWFAGDEALVRVIEEHDSGAWVTYGSFKNSDGSPGFASAYAPGESYRKGKGNATHLKTMRAGLVAKIKKQDLMGNGRLRGADGWLIGAADVALIMPCLDMAAERARFIPDVLCVYTLSKEWQDPTKRRLEHESANYIRSLPSYGRLEELTR